MFAEVQSGETASGGREPRLLEFGVSGQTPGDPSGTPHSCLMGQTTCPPEARLQALRREPRPLCRKVQLGVSYSLTGSAPLPSPLPVRVQRV